MAWPPFAGSKLPQDAKASKYTSAGRAADPVATLLPWAAEGGRRSSYLFLSDLLATLGNTLLAAALPWALGLASCLGIQKSGLSPSGLRCAKVLALKR